MNNLTLHTKIILAAAAAVALAAGAGWLRSTFEIKRLENRTAAADANAAKIQAAAEKLEREAEGYKAKIEYLEKSVAQIGAAAKKQDEELSHLENLTGRARDNAERARRIRSIAVTRDELCRKLDSLGHGCSENE
jgi:hypothetical protein